ncbi:hypothetical protein OsI_33648 [Oryza sativa Indica Group]|uniref:Uncharacterized protein n=1 Tax=Oryza sativa subsp. indica TaxID=39946 RepID=A2Z7G5_ORYSI|nr:hypothetical protein OsI_33648 [Oryza sativa Indica Group]
MPTPEPSTSASAIVSGTVTGHHVLTIDGYSRTKAKLPTGRFTASRPFTVGGHSWSIHYYPSGDRSDTAGFISVFLELNPAADAAAAAASAGGGSEPVDARVTFSLLDQAGRSVPSHTMATDLHDFAATGFGFGRFIERSYLEQSEHLKNDRFAIRCDVVVFSDELRAEARTADAAALSVAVPPSDLSQHLGGLLAAKELGADVTFLVAGETFTAHRCVLAARSPVFRAELFGPMKESAATAVITVDDIEPDVFRNLLTFMYTDTLPETNPQELEEEEDDDDDDDYEDDQAQAAAMVEHLLIAADRYNLERLKLICEDRLCKHIDGESVATILALAEQHSCDGLKEACFQFLSSRSALNSLVATDGIEHLARWCPSVLNQLMSKVAALVPVDFVVRETR